MLLLYIILMFKVIIQRELSIKDNKLVVLFCFTHVKIFPDVIYYSILNFEFDSK